jgi:FMN phosphatase YigB (HAD superfamily)
VANETIVELQQENDAAERTIVELRASLDRWTQSWANAIQERDQARRERDKAEQDCQAWAQNYREAQESIGLLHHRIEQLKRGDSDVRQRTRDAIGDYRKPGWRWAWTDLWLAIKTMRAQISEAQNVMDLCVSPESNVAERELAIAQWRAMGSEGE